MATFFKRTYLWLIEPFSYGIHDEDETTFSSVNSWNSLRQL